MIRDKAARSSCCASCFPVVSIVGLLATEETPTKSPVDLTFSLSNIQTRNFHRYLDVVTHHHASLSSDSNYQVRISGYRIHQLVFCRLQDKE